MKKTYVFKTDEELENKGIELDPNNLADVYYMICRDGKEIIPCGEIRDTIIDFIENYNCGFALIDIEAELEEKGLIVVE